MSDQAITGCRNRERGCVKRAWTVTVTRLLFIICLLLAWSHSGAQHLLPLPLDLSQLPDLGVNKDEAVRFLDKAIRFSEIKDRNGLVNVAGEAASGKIRVNFKCAGKMVVAASVAVPPASLDPAEVRTQALKHGIVLRFLMNIFPGRDWTNPDKNPVADALGLLSRYPEETWSTRIGDKFIFANREVYPGLISIGVIPWKFRKKPYDIGSF